MPEQDLCSCTIVYAAESGEVISESFPVTNTSLCQLKADAIAEDFEYQVLEVTIDCY